MNKFKSVGRLKEFDVKPGSYTTKMWIDGKKSDKDINIKTYRGKMSVEVDGNTITFEINSADRRIFFKKEDLKNKNFPVSKSYSNIEKFIDVVKENPHVKIRISGEAIDNSYFSENKGIVEMMSYRADFITVVDDNTEEEFYLNATTFIGGYEEMDDGNYRLAAYVSPSWGKKYFPIRSSNKDDKIYVAGDNFDVILDNCSEDGEKITKSMVATYKIKFVNKGNTKKKGGAKSFGDYQEMTSGWTEQELWIVGGEFVEPTYKEQENEDGEIVEVCTNANQVIERKDYLKAKKERPTMLEGLEDKYKEYKKKKAATKVDDDLDDLDDI